jgi:hypothetical protein
MPSNLTIGKTEIDFLREKIMSRYSSLVGYDLQQFEKSLTGTISIYERIDEVMADYLEEESNIRRYMSFLKDSPLKLQLRKWAESTDQERKRYLRDWRGHLSGSVLRKLLFYGRTESSQTYKEGVINALYCYVHQDRQEFLSTNPAAVHAPRKGTISVHDLALPREPAQGGDLDKTQPPYSQERAFILRRLTENNSIDVNRQPLVFDGEIQYLNRANIDPENMTITSKAQAEVRFEDGQWWLEDKSVLRTTFIQVNKRTKIAKGDIIVMGNRRFLFDEPEG